MIYIFLIFMAILVIGILEWREGRKLRLEGDFSSFDRWCPVKGCGWRFQTDEDFAEHILKNKHGIEI